MADNYTMLEELGSESASYTLELLHVTDLSAGGSFGVVYKALEKSTGELVAIKHVGLRGLAHLCPMSNIAYYRSTSKAAMTISEKSSRKYLC